MILSKSIWLIASICKKIIFFMDMGTLTCLFGGVVVW